MTLAHSTLTDPNLHEPKGVSSASANTVYLADGAASGSWSLIPSASLQSPADFKKLSVAYTFVDVSTASSQWICSPVNGTIVGIFSVLHGAIGTDDVAFTFEIGGMAVTNGAITITQSGSAAGDVDSSTPTANNDVSQGQSIEIISDGASSNTVNATFTFLIQES